MKYYVYILKCSNGTLYAGSTNNLNKRLNEHNNFKNGAKYTKARKPVFLVYKEICKTFREMRAKEAEIKRLTRKEKIDLVKAQ